MGLLLLILILAGDAVDDRLRDADGSEGRPVGGGQPLGGRTTRRAGPSSTS